ncbi:BREX-2 system adenine-specific DNA-methyltransferase PglX [Promicromonospora sp. NPDC057138]|uniref:BREX-2 system adenine-specific DNA-methyltransferase PglX n=1 Tax=Promicromonospora sp. NPDC057138 TaxID=3346031 RepID=UPI0036295E57
MISSTALLKDLKAQLKAVQEDLQHGAGDSTTTWGGRLQRQYHEAFKRERTGLTWAEWSRNEVEQAAVAWILTTTFVRFCEDNDLLVGATLDGLPVAVGWIAGPGDRTDRAAENQTAFFRTNPTLNLRYWLQEAFGVLAAQPAGAALVDRKHNAVWSAEISQWAASGLIDFWRRTDTAGNLVHDFTDPDLDTRFLGDLYQDLSDHARDTYALLQTPDFIEGFILDRTLTPALREVSLGELRLIDPTCGSGHFLLGAFRRLDEAWAADAPGLDAKERVRRAMDSLHGVDLNPFAIAIARFRLTVAGMLTQGERSLVGLAPMGFHLAIGDSLLGEQGGAPEGQRLFDHGTLDLGIDGTLDDAAKDRDVADAEAGYQYDAEDLGEYTGILTPGRYHVVVGNPPYITVKDKVLNAAYRKAYKTAHMKYQLTVPFMELFFRLAVKGQPGRSAGHVGQITGNGFMKREFGKKLVEDLFAGYHQDNPVDLTEVIDTAGVPVPGHNTPTVILVGRRRNPVGGTVRAVLGVRGEPGQPVDPAEGLVWSEISGHVDDSEYDGTYVTVTDLRRDALKKHPWSLSGGGAGAAMEALAASSDNSLGLGVVRIGFFGVMGADDAFTMVPGVPERLGADDSFRDLTIGDEVRDFVILPGDRAFFPYTSDHDLEGLDSYPEMAQRLWSLRTELGNRATFSKQTYFAEGRPWYEWHQLPKDEGANPWAITFAEVATHNHFAVDRGGKVFKQTAPVIKLSESANEQDHLELLGVLNSSTACFWLKQVSHNKGSGADARGGRQTSAPWEDFYQFGSTKLLQFPLPSTLPGARGHLLDTLGQSLTVSAPRTVVTEVTADDPTWSGDPGWLESRLDKAREEWQSLRERMVFEQEELDWEVYRLYGLIDEDLTYVGARSEADRRLVLGQRAFEIALARKVEAGEDEIAWFDRHGSVPIADLPLHWPVDYRALVERRLALIESDPTIRLLEKPEFKRRWATTPWAKQRDEALRTAILDRLEGRDLWRDADGQPVTRSVAELTDLVAGDGVLRELAIALTGAATQDLAKLLTALAPGEAVPYLAAYRYKPSGLVKFRAWQQVWDLQRREDAGAQVEIPVPPKYVSADFRPGVWTHRGKLDVPKERFVLYPGVGRRGDTTPVLGWAGWDHRDQAFALGGEIARQHELGVGDEELLPLLGGLVELEPWLRQWHSEVDPVFNASPADLVAGLLDEELARLETTREAVTAWAPPVGSRGRKKA